MLISLRYKQLLVFCTITICEAGLLCSHSANIYEEDGSVDCDNIIVTAIRRPSTGPESETRLTKIHSPFFDS